MKLLCPSPMNPGVFHFLQFLPSTDSLRNDTLSEVTDVEQELYVINRLRNIQVRLYCRHNPKQETS
jgi:hypothetical protein